MYYLPLHWFVVSLAICMSKADYGYGDNEPQSDVGAPSYIPSYLRHQSPGSWSFGTKTGYQGTKSGYGTKSSYGTKSGSYSGTKSGSYSGTKSGSYSGTKSGYHGSHSYTGSKSWPTNTGSVAQYGDFYHSANQFYTPRCNPPCQNEGICVDGTTCHCPPDNSGKYCEFKKVPCLTHPPMPTNSEKYCSAEFCTFTCAPGHKYPDGSTVASMRCEQGQWKPTRVGEIGLSDCYPVCEPECTNDGVCLSDNQCQCPRDRRGPQCQYSADDCTAAGLGFNGGYSCHGDGESFSCSLSCAPGSKFSAQPAHQYTCLYSTGVFEPQPIPHCVVEEIVIVTPSNYHQAYEVDDLMQGRVNSSYSETHHSKTHHSETHHTVTQVIVQDLTPKPGTCLVWAGSHYKTFDGHIYSFKSPCQHVLLRNADKSLMVAVRHKQCKRQSSCPAELTFVVGDKEYVLAVDDEGSVIFRSSRRLIPVPARLPALAVATRGANVAVTLPAASLLWDTDNLIQIEASTLLWNKTEGLCGTLDGVAETDMKLEDGSQAKSQSSFVSSWQTSRIGETCDNTPSDANACIGKSDEIKREAKAFCTKIFSHSKFRKCSAVMDVLSLLETCQWDYCSGSETLSPEESACATVGVYAQECFRHGVEEIKTWRDDETCPMRCPDGKIYKACGPESPASCAFPEVSIKPTNETCVEGCFCPEDLLLEAGKCVPKEQCPCRLRNRSFEPGATVTKECNTCKCQSGEWTCTKQSCGARCGTYGDPHYTTFDGLRYDFMGRCTYYLVQTDNLTVEVENVACSTSESQFQPATYAAAETVGKPSCTKTVTVRTAAVVAQLKQAGLIVVNGKEVTTLPVTVGDVLIRAASSLFVIVQLPSGIDIWWDGKTRTYVDVPPEFRDKTKGLCGTFNENQKDDFLTTEGDVEQSAFAFANKWKTREACSDVSTKEPDHPCDANVLNKEAAEKYCSKLKSKLFESCHWYVDVTPFYEACVYDMCACAGDVPRCLCAVLGDYAGRCAAAGLHLQWRYNVKECEVSCSGGQEYTVCADSCARTCADAALAHARRCRPACVEGCACAKGQVLDENNVCVPIAQCPCYHEGMEFKPGYKEVRAGRRERELCTCIGSRWDCTPASPDDIQKYPAAGDLRTNCSAARNMEFTTCEPAPVTCKNMHLAKAAPAAECRAGCVCRPGYVMDMSAHRCVPPAHCPCHHGGRSYHDGETVTEECNTCTCKSGNWSCSARACAGVCAAWGDSHVLTYDGAQYDFEGVCSYLLAKGCLGAGRDEFQVDIQNVPCGTTGATCSKSVTLKVGGGGGGGEEVVDLTVDAPLPDVSALSRIKLREAGSFVFLDVPSLGVALQWDRGMRVAVRADAMWNNRVKGLCGNFNGDLRDDFQTPSGGDIAEASPLIFADSWKLKPTCPKPEAVREHCQQRPERKGWAVATCGALKRPPFSLCHTEVPPGPFVDRCERDACACDSGDDCQCACTALAMYAQLCAARGVAFKWRKQELCPMQCDEECSTYDPCMSPCPAETCDNTLYYEEIKTSCAKDACVEGCKPKKDCAEGTVYANATSKSCVPRATCKPVCMRVEGKVVLEGELLEQDACHTCSCSRGKRVCTGQPCPTDPTPLTTPTAAPDPPPPSLQDEQLKCRSGWTEWVSQAGPTTNGLNESVEAEPLPEAKRFPIGTPMCKPAMMKNIECRTMADHRPSKDTGLDVECSLERGLLCRESNGVCPDFEIRVYCQCDDEPFQCLNSTRPSHPHPSDCNKFYECTPEGPASSAHAVLKRCAEGLMYNPRAMVCDWPAAVEIIRPECKNTTGESTEIFTGTTPTFYTAYTVTLPTTTKRACPAGQVYKSCAFPCDKLCDHFKKTVIAKGLCMPGQKCIEGCIDEAVANTKCELGSLWRDEKTCVPIKDCTCFSDDGKIVKPGGVTSEGCIKCQCLDDAMHCDSSQCVSAAPPAPGGPPGPTHQAMVVTAPPRPPTTPAPLLIVTTTSPPPQCPPNRYVNLVEDLPESSFSSSSVVNQLFGPQYARLDAHPSDLDAGCWSPLNHDQNQYIQVEFERREPLYGVIIQGSPLFDQYVTSYELMYGDQPDVFETLKDSDEKTRILRGPIDHNNAVKQMFNPPIEAKYVRIRPLTWHDEISLRFELIGCHEDLTTTEITTPTPVPMKCKDLLGLAAGLPVENIEVSSNSDKRNLFRLDGHAGWTPLYSTPGEWIMFDFESPREITGIKTAGGPSGWVTAYQIMYTSDLSTFSPVLDKDGATANFPGNSDAESVALNQFQPPIHARYLKVLPVRWHGAPEMRLEPLGCFEPYSVPMKCKDQVGLAAGLPVENIEVSSNSDKRNLFRLDGHAGWTPLHSAPGEWIMFDFESPREITGIKTAGGPSGWVTAYQIMYTSDLSTFSPVLDKDGATANFPGNSDAESVALNQFQPPIHARYLKVLPVRWHGAPEMRLEPLGCFEPYMTPSTSPPMKCTDLLGLAAGLPVENIEVSSNSDKRDLLHLDGHAGWTPLHSAPGEWIMFDFESPREITGIKTAGGPSGWVTAYQIMYTSDLSTFSPVLDKDGATANFPGNSDAESVALNQFQPPIHARYLKVLPVRWHGAPEMRLEPLGCFEPYMTPSTSSPMKCTDQLGLAAGLPVENIEVSSNSDKRNLFRLDGHAGWTPLHSAPGEWIMFDFESPREITGIKTAGGPSGWVTAYQIMYTSDLSTFSPVLDKDGATANFPGNSDAESVALNQFQPPIHARYLKVLPVRWHGAPEMRIEPLGCFEPYMTPSTSPPMKCTDQLGLAAGLPVENIEVSSNSDKRNLFRLDGHAGWTPLHSAPGEWIMFDFESPREITGIKTAGGPSGWVTAYQIMYTSDLSTFSPVLDKDGATANFPGNSDAESVALNQFQPPIHARYLKVLPVRWHGAPEMRLEPLGCFEPYMTPSTSPPMKCTDQLGLAAGLPVENIEVSSNSDKRDLFRLDGHAGWTPLHSAPGEWIMFDFESPREITGIKTAGGPSGWVTAYQIMYTSDLSTFSPVLDKDGATANFPGNSDAESVALNQFQPPIHARYLKVLPVRWHGAPEMRLEPLGCFEPYIVKNPRIPLSPTTSPPMKCTDQLGLAAGLPVENIEVSSNSDKRNLFRLDGHAGWTPLYSAPGEWIMFDFESPREITGIKTAGGPSGWVTAYQIMYTSDLFTFSPVLDKDGATANFPGNSDAESVALNQFQPPIHARYLKVLPVRWHGAPEMRIEPLGCFEPYIMPPMSGPTPAMCTDQLGLAAGLPVENIEVSSNSDKRNLFRLDGHAGWTPLYSAPGEWIMFDFESPREITGIKTAGGPSGWVTAYQIMYTSDLSTFSPVLDKDGATANFPGNSDAESVAMNQFQPPIHARYLKVLPVRWHGAPEMRLEPLGCFEPYMSPSTSPPMKCTDQLGLAAGLPVENIEVSSNSDKRNLFRLDGHAGWTPLYSTPGEWIMFDFQSPREITGIKTAGGPGGWVTAYQIMYTSDLTTFSPVLDKDGATANFPGNSDAESVALNQFQPPIHARYLKVLPVHWHGASEMRLEPLGCFEPYVTPTNVPTKCLDDIGLGAALPVDHIEVSSNSDKRNLLRLDGHAGWTPLHSAPGEWIMFDFESPREITGIKTAGGPSGWVTAYQIMYTSDLSTFSPVLDKDGATANFPGNSDAESVALNQFQPPIHARYLKVLPVRWHGAPEMRLEPLGCFEPLSATTTYWPCALCPGAMAPSSGACACGRKEFYDGENCVSRDQCPCFVGFMSYPVGATFRGTNCDECLCKLGGVTICRAPADCKCQPDMVPKQAKDTCACQCEPCRNGTRICPTSKLCLALDKWCDGLQDCPDDEVACTTVGTTATTEPTVVTTHAPTLAAIVSTPKPKVECPVVECPAGYSVHFTSGPAPRRAGAGAALPPPRARLAYQRYRKGGPGGQGGTKAYRGYSAAKAGFAKGGYAAYQPPRINQDFTLDAPTVEKPKSQAEECRQFKCVPKLPPYRPGVKPPPCSTPLCPPHYSLKLEAVATRGECPQYVCVPPPERPVYCNMTGRTITTFDGAEYKYDVCFHILARDAGGGAWTVIVRKKCRIDSCQNELMIRQDDQLILLKPNLMIEYNNYEYTVEQTSLICFQKNSFNLDKLGNGLVVSSRKYNFTVLFNTEGDIKVGVYKSYLNAVDGLCGFYDGDASNDRRLPSGRAALSVETFGDAWAKPGLPRNACRSKAVAPELQRRRWELCSVIAKEPLSRCGKVLNLDRWRNICLEKICDCVAMEVNGTRRTEEQCRCLLLEQFVAECLAADKDIELDWRTQMDCPAVCPAPLAHYECYRRACEPQCSTLGVGRPCAGLAGQCSPGCYCPEGQLRQGDTCVAPQNCLDCACNGAGTKYTTFERDDLPLGGNCTYLASRDRNETGQYIYQVYVTNGPCDGNSATICTKVIHLIHEHKVIRIEPNPQTKKLQVTVEGAMVFEFPTRREWGSVRQFNGQDVVVALTDAHVALRVQPSMEFEVRVPSHLFGNRTVGLCGVCAGYVEHLVAGDGNLTDDLDEYSNSWQAKGEILTTLGVKPQEQCGEPVEEECVPPPPEKNPCYNILNVEKFGACHALLEPQSYLEACTAELCAGAPPCASLQRYAADCRRHGICLAWRGPALCPYDACESPLVYRACMGCELTCDNYDEMSDVSCDKQLVEGCYCPEGKVRVNGTCIEPAKCFPCDANKEHYAGEEWQKDACTKCTCSKLPKENVAHVACVTQTCSQPVCSEREDLKTKPAKPGACCQEYVCVPQPINTPHCEEPKQIECGFGQVVKQKSKPDGCMEFTCECKPASECEPLPSPSSLPPLAAGMVMVRDDSGCCPRAAPQCRPAACPAAPACPPPRQLLTANTSACCPSYDCVVPKDKCLVTLAWEASMNGGEVPRNTPEEVLKDLDASWPDGPCRLCRCGPRAAVACAAHSCVAPPDDQFVLAPRPVPLACCPRHQRAACRYRGKVYQPGEKWQSEDEPCKSYECKQLEDLELVTNVQTCNTDCQLGWQYVPAAAGQCCGKCVAVACVAGGRQHAVGSHWAAPDFCTNYTCLDVNGTLQVQSANETCPEVSEGTLKQFVVSEEVVPGNCCKRREPIACRVGDRIYPEGQTWPTSDPCTNTSCARDAGGRLAHVPRVQACARACPRAWRLGAPARGRCCGECEQVACLQDDEVKPIGATWYSADNCTTYACERTGPDVVVTSSREACPGVAACPPDRLHLDGCCMRCRPEALDQKIEPCKPESLPDEESVGIVRVERRGRGRCANRAPLPQFKECRGSCVSGTLYNNQTGSHDSKCECCQVIKYEPLDVVLICEDGGTLEHQVGSPVLCACRGCGDAGGLVGRPSGTKTGKYTGQSNQYADYAEIPDIYRRFGVPQA